MSVKVTTRLRAALYPDQTAMNETSKRHVTGSNESHASDACGSLLRAVVTCPMPDGSVLDRNWVETASYRDAYRVSLALNDATVVDIFFAVFGHHPTWLKAVLLARHRVGVWFGLDAASAAEILRPHQAQSYRVGQQIGPWPIFFLSDAELVAGRNNKHLDFRLSVRKELHPTSTTVIVSTVCIAHNVAGRAYLRAITPFHAWGVQRLIKRAVQAGRL